MQFKNITLILTSCISLINAVHFERIYGVAEKDLGKYQKTPDGLFHCLDGTQVIPYSALNDDYCDCDDGSDEPGTSACINGVFYCNNVGNVGHYIPSSRVNDGVCDYDFCCDGSDEYNGRIKCPSRCEEIAKKLEIDRKKRVLMMYKAFHNHQIMIMKAMQNITQDTTALEENKIAYEKESSKLEEMKARIKELEKIESENKDFYKVLYKQLVKDYKTKKDNLKKAIEDILKIKNTKNIDQVTLDTLLNNYNESLLEELNRPIISNEDDANADTDVNVDVNANENENDEAEPEEDIDEYEKEEKRQIAKIEAKYKVIKKELSELRVEKNDVDRTAKDYKREMEKLQKKLEMDSGFNNIFYSLYGETFSFNTTDYIYTLKWGIEIKQKQVKGALTLLGKYKEFRDEHKSIFYDDGAQCWQGPKRSVVVKLVCSPENLILRVDEPNKCEYEIEFGTPGACTNDDIQALKSEATAEDDPEFSEEMLESIKEMLNESPTEKVLNEEDVEQLDDEEDTKAEEIKVDQLNRDEL